MAEEIRLRASDPETARAEIEQTRARLSGTIDEIEDVLIRKRERVRRQLDVIARIREKPLHAAGIVLGLGVLAGFISGGSVKERERRVAADERASLWEARARRLLAIARSQEEEIEDLELSLAELERHLQLDSDEQEELDDEDSPSRWSEFRETVVERVGEYLSTAAGLAGELRRRL